MIPMPDPEEERLKDAATAAMAAMMDAWSAIDESPIQPIPMSLLVAHRQAASAYDAARTTLDNYRNERYIQREKARRQHRRMN